MTTSPCILLNIAFKIDLEHVPAMWKEHFLKHQVEHALVARLPEDPVAATQYTLHIFTKHVGLDILESHHVEPFRNNLDRPAGRNGVLILLS
ncbi:hypothetical protein SCARR_02727 [Pontiella sulfatireligans]|uniref:Uncharacterized protein n=1 Tax=Pontiella sulfatireligans TaxID=2750658 RepID=A0A6C2UN06_9BACT|nr:hypothetical protein SCARR_02727 [Pontiella sulfatireligans]